MAQRRRLAWIQAAACVGLLAVLWFVWPASRVATLEQIPNRFETFPTASDPVTGGRVLDGVPNPPDIPEPAEADARDATPELLAIGAVQSDGHLIPIALRRNGKWRGLTVDVSDFPSDHVELTPEARGLAGPGWVAFPLDGRAARPLTIRAIGNADRFCSGEGSFLTDAPTQPFPEHDLPKPKTALAVLGGAVPVGVEDLKAPYYGDADRAARFIRALVESHEQELTSTQSDWLAEVPLEARARATVAIGSFARHRRASTSTYHFNAAKSYDSGHILHVSGWLSITGDQTTSSDVTVEFSDDEPKGLMFFVPLSVLELPDRDIWVLHGSGWESESNALMEVTGRQFRHLLTVDSEHC